MADITDQGVSNPPKPGTGIGPNGLVATNCCDKDSIPKTLNAFVEVKGGAFSCVTGTYELFYLPSFNEWASYDHCESCKETQIFTALKCNWPGNNWTLFISIKAGRRKLTPNMKLTKENCDNFELDFAGQLFLTYPITVTIRPLPPDPSQLA